jgi:glycogen operon protein
LYAYRVDGRCDPPAGYCFDSAKILLDPFAPAVFFPPDYDRIAAGLPGRNDGRAPSACSPI